jgi:hypothetical protein
MFEKIGRSWELVKASWQVLRSDKELLVYPVVSFFASILVLITFAIPMIVAGLFDAMVADGGISIVGVIMAFLFYLVLYTVVFFCNTALVGAVMIRLNGGDPTLADGFRIASSKIGKILGYAAISATVGMILRAIAERGIIGQIVSSIIGFVWNVATFLVVPVLVVEDIGPVDAIKRSAELLKKTWGEQLVANFGIGTVFGLISFGVIILGGVLAGLFAAISPALAVLAVIATILALIALGLLSATLSGIFTAALYRYAVEGQAGEFFNPEVIQGAFVEKPKRSIFG